MHSFPFQFLRNIALFSMLTGCIAGCSSARAVKSANAYAKQLQTEDHQAILSYNAVYYDTDSRIKGVKWLCYNWDKNPSELVSQFTCLNSLSEAKGAKVLYVKTTINRQWGNVVTTYSYHDQNEDGKLLYQSSLTNNNVNLSQHIKNDLTLRSRMSAGIQSTS